MRYLIVILGFLPLSVSAQFNISLSTGVAAFTAMSDLKNNQVYLQNSWPVKPKVISSFPAYWTYHLNLKWMFDNGIIIGGEASYTSTGGRIYYSDYSGHMIYDQMLKGYSTSTFIGKAFHLKDESLMFQFYLLVGTTYTYYEDHFSEAEPQRSSGNELSATSQFLQPTVNFSKRFGIVAANVNTGYYQTLLAGSFSSDNAQLPASADWSGLRFTCGVTFYFSKGKANNLRSGL
jgi:hypothetical protein